MAAMVATMPFDPAPSSAARPRISGDQSPASGSDPQPSHAQGSKKEASFPEAPPSREPQESNESSSDEDDEEGSEEGEDDEMDDDSSEEAAVTEDDVARAIDWLMEVESEAQEAQEALEEESVSRVRQEVEAELAEKLSGEELEKAVKREMDAYIAEWQRTLNELEEESAKLQERLDDANVSLPEIFKTIERQAADGCETEAWRRRTHWSGTQASEEVAELLHSAEVELERQRPVMRRRGKLVEEGASGFLESKVKMEEGSSSGVGWSLLDELGEPRRNSERPESLFKSKGWASVYAASTPEQASRLGLRFPGVNKVEEIGDLNEALGLEATALAEESANGLTEHQKLKLKRVCETDDLLEMKQKPRKKKSKQPAKKQTQAPVTPQIDPADETDKEFSLADELLADASASAKIVMRNVQDKSLTNRSPSPDVPVKNQVYNCIQETRPREEAGPSANGHVAVPKDEKLAGKKVAFENIGAGKAESGAGKAKSGAGKAGSEAVRIDSSPEVILAKSDPPELVILSDDDDEDDEKTEKRVTGRKRALERGSSSRSNKRRKYVYSSDEEEDHRGVGTEKKSVVSEISSSDEEEEVKDCECTICATMLSRREVVAHPVLRVIICARCKRLFDRTLFSEDGDTDAECSWCGQYGEVFCCDNESCRKVFCESCIERNANLQAIAGSDNWLCFVCDPSPLAGLRKLLEEAGGGKGAEKLLIFEASSSSLSRQKRRKNIRKMITDEELNETTRHLQEIEKERRERLNKWYEAAAGKSKRKEPLGKCRAAEKISDERHICEGDCQTLGCVINITDQDTGEPLIRIPPSISKSLKPHQLSGIRFMWENCIESVSKVNSGSKGLGCILAHCMGLGKTLQVIAFLYTVMRAADLKTALIVVPVNVLHNWRSEFALWQPEEVPRLPVYMLEDATRENAARATHLGNWQEKGGVMLIGYSAFRILCNGRNVRDPETRNLFRKYLQDPGPDLLVCDEAHTIKNEKADITHELQQVKSRRRIALTGSPLQNNLLEYYCMVNFVREGFLGKPHEFRNSFVNPIANGQHADSTHADVKKMKQRAHVLHARLEGFVQRRDNSVLESEIPPKCVWVISVRLSALQKELYRKYLSSGLARKHLFNDFHSLSKIWNHPDVLRLAKEAAKESKDAQQFIVVDSDKDEEAEEGGEKRKAESPEVNNFEWCEEILSSSEANVVENGGKILLLLKLLAMISSQGEKVLVFSQSLVTLDLIEKFLERTPLPSGIGFWTKSKDWYRLDGSTSGSIRQRIANRFNDPSNTVVKCFLISTRAGSLGINLTGACRVVIVDGSWNPTHDLQALYRSWRLGQTKPVYVYRLLAYGTMEEKIYHRQLSKEGIAARVLDAHQVGRHLNANDLEILYEFNDDEDEAMEDENQARKAKPKAFSAPSDAPPRDELMAMLLLEYRPSVIASYHEHEPLLVNLEDENLSPDEKIQAWEAFRKEHEPQPATPGQESPGESPPVVFPGAPRAPPVIPRPPPPVTPRAPQVAPETPRAPPVIPRPPPPVTPRAPQVAPGAPQVPPGGYRAPPVQPGASRGPPQAPQGAPRAPPQAQQQARGPQKQGGCDPNAHRALLTLRNLGKDDTLVCGQCHQRIGWGGLQDFLKK